MTSERRTLCVLFADVAGSTRLYEKLGDAQALRAVGMCLTCMREATHAWRGRIVKSIGDGVLAVFDTATEAMHAACAMHMKVDDLPLVAGVKLGIRIGFQHGPVLEEGSDYFGDTVNTAAGVTALAKPDQILTTADTIAALPPALRKASRALDSLNVKGKLEEIRIFEIIWQEPGDVTVIAEDLVPPAAFSTRLMLQYRGAQIILDANRGRVAVGRDDVCEVVVSGKRTSRHHARIEWRRDKFVLTDQSTNGTFVLFDGEPEIVLKREEVPLRGRGWICFGDSVTQSESDIMEFEVLSR
jgi:class 3 adenylate cyclase